MKKSIREHSLEEMMPLIMETLSEGSSVTFSPRGTSMLPMLRQGRDTVTLSPLPEKLQRYDIPLYRRADGHYVLHRIVKSGDTYTCIGDNQFILEDGLVHDQMIGVVSAFSRDGKRHSVNEISYRLYVRFWHYSRPVRYVLRAIRSRIGKFFKKSGGNG